MRRMHDDKEVVSEVKVSGSRLVIEDAAGNEKEFTLPGGGSINPEILLENMEGSDTISVDLNEDESKVIVKLDQDVTDDIDEALSKASAAEVDIDELQTQVGTLQDEVGDLDTGKLDATKDAVSTVGGLVIPNSAPATDKLVGIDTTNGQELITIGDNLTLEDGVLSATGGGGGPTEYIKSAAVVGDTLTLVDQDDGAVTFSSGSLDGILHVPVISLVNPGTPYDLVRNANGSTFDTAFVAREMRPDTFTPNGSSIVEYDARRTSPILDYNAVYNSRGDAIFMFDPGHFIEVETWMNGDFTFSWADGGSLIANQGVITFRCWLDGTYVDKKWGYNEDDFESTSGQGMTTHYVFRNLKPGQHHIKFEVLENTYPWENLPENKTRNDGGINMGYVGYGRPSAMGGRGDVTFAGTGITWNTCRGTKVPTLQSSSQIFVPSANANLYVPYNLDGTLTIPGTWQTHLYTVNFYDGEPGNKGTLVGTQNNIAFKGQYTLPDGYTNKYVNESHTVQGNLDVFVTAIEAEA